MSEHVVPVASCCFLLLIAGLTESNASPVVIDPAQSQVESVERSVQRYVYPDPEIPTIEDAPGYKFSQLQARERRFQQRIWSLLSAGKYDAVHREISQRRKGEKGWQPDAHLLSEIERGETGKKINAARHDPKAFIAINKSHPERFSCYEYYNLWSLSDAYARIGNQTVSSEIDHQVLASCKQPDVLVKTLERVYARDGAQTALAFANELALRNDIAIPAAAIRHRQYQWSLGLASALRDKGKVAEALYAIQPFEEQITNSRDADAAQLLAWSYHDAGDRQGAVKWFSAAADWSGHEDDRLYALQERWNGGSQEAVMQWLNTHTLSGEAGRSWAASVLRSEAAKNYSHQHYTLSLAELDRALHYSQPEPPESSVLRGWANYHTGDYDSAYEAFAAAYASDNMTQDEKRNVVGALLYTTKQTGKWSQLNTLANKQQGQLLAQDKERTLVKRLIAGELGSEQVQVEQGRLVLVRNGSDEAVVSAGMGIHSKRGEGGNDQLLLAQFPQVMVQAPLGNGVIFARMDHYSIDSGDIDDGTWIGSGRWGVDTAQRGVDFDSSGMGELAVGLQLGDSPLYFEAGRTAESDVLSSTWMGQLHYSALFRSGEVKARLYRRPRRDSKLAYVGMDDPFSTTSWGRVMEQGGALDGYSKIREKWNLGFHAALFTLRGINVVDNNGGDAYMAMQREFHPDSQTLFQAGPYLYATSYKKNLNHFTLGQGGYFSPQRLFQPGVSALWQYQSPSLIYHLRLGVGYQIEHGDSTERFPLNDDGTTWASADNRGVTGIVKLSWAKQMSNTPWQWSGLVSVADGPDYAQRDAWIFLRYNFDGRAKVRYSDLPQQMTPSLPGVP